MLFLVLFITAFTAVVTQDLLGVSYFFDSNFYNTFSEKNCGNATQWDLVSYGRELVIVPPYEESSTPIVASKNSCTSSFSIAFHKGTLDLTVYIRTISKHSGITITVFDEEDIVITTARYHRLTKHFITGWTVISLPITKHTTGYIQLSGQSLAQELVIIDSLRYIPDNTTILQNLENADTSKNPPVQENISTKESNVAAPYIFEFDEIDSSGGGEDDGGDDNESGTEDPNDSTTDDPETEEGDTDNPAPEEEDSDDPEDTGFWNAFTITLVSVGGFVVLGTIGVGSYYLGKSRGTSANVPFDIEDLEPPRVVRVPRVRSIFSDGPSEPFSRFS